MGTRQLCYLHESACWRKQTRTTPVRTPVRRARSRRLGDNVRFGSEELRLGLQHNDDENGWRFDALRPVTRLSMPPMTGGAVERSTAGRHNIGIYCRSFPLRVDQVTKVQRVGDNRRPTEAAGVELLNADWSHFVALLKELLLPVLRPSAESHWRVRLQFVVDMTEHAHVLVVSDEASGVSAVRGGSVTVSTVASPRSSTWPAILSP